MSRSDRTAAAGLLLILGSILLGAVVTAVALPFDQASVALGEAEARFWIAVTRIGDALPRIFAGLCAAAWLAWRGAGNDALLLLSVTAVETVIGEGMKEAFVRTRPALVPHLDQVVSLAYPSGHAAHSGALYLLGAALIGRRVERRESRRALLILAAVLVMLIGFSRVMLGVHWPSDVVGGWMLGAGFALVGLALAAPTDRR